MTALQKHRTVVRLLRDRADENVVEREVRPEPHFAWHLARVDGKCASNLLTDLRLRFRVVRQRIGHSYQALCQRAALLEVVNLAV